MNYAPVRRGEAGQTWVERQQPTGTPPRFADVGNFFAYEGACGIPHRALKLSLTGGRGKEPPAPTRSQPHAHAPACT